MNKLWSYVKVVINCFFANSTSFENYDYESHDKYRRTANKRQVSNLSRFSFTPFVSPP
jgi:hypothetical protein